MDAHFNGVSLGALVNGSRTWAHDVDLSVGAEGITVGNDTNDTHDAHDVSGTAGDPAGTSTLPWSAVHRFAPGFTLAFPDGRPATELEVALADREISLLVPATQLPPSLVKELIALASSKTKDDTIVPLPAPPPFSPAGTSATGVAGVSKARIAGTITAPPAPPPPAPGGSGTGPDGRSRRKPVLVGAGAAVVAIAVAIAIVFATAGSSPAKSAAARSRTRHSKTAAPSTPTSDPVPAHELSGPPVSADPKTVVAAVMIKPSDVKGYAGQDDGGADTPGYGQLEAQATTGNPLFPSEVSLLQPSFGILQQCSNLPDDHLQLLTNNYYSGGPPTWTSDTYIPDGDNFSDLSPTAPQILTTASVVASAAVQESDFSALAQGSFASCLQSYFLSFVRATVSQDGGNVDSLTVKAVPVKSIPGVETLEYDLNAQIVAVGNTTPYRCRMVFFGAGRMEQMLEAYDSSAQGIASPLWSSLVTTLQHRMASVASETGAPASRGKTKK